MGSANHEQVAQLLASYQQRLSGYIRTLVPMAAEADDLLQEVNLFIWRRADEYQPGTNFGAWAYQIARYHVMTHRKRVARGHLRFSDAVIEQIAAAGPDAEFSRPRMNALEHCLQQLSEKDLALVRLRYEPEATTQSVAQRCGRSLKAVYHALNRIRTTLLECIQQTIASEGQ